MHPNKPCDRQDADEVFELCENYDELLELGESIGMANSGIIGENGQPEFVGSKQQWEKYEELKLEKNL